MQLAFTIVLPVPSALFLGFWIVLAAASTALWLWGSPEPRTLADRLLDAGWRACVPSTLLCFPLVWATRAFAESYIALADQLAPSMLLPLDLSLLGTLYVVCVLLALVWRSRRATSAETAPEEPVLSS